MRKEERKTQCSMNVLAIRGKCLQRLLHFAHEERKERGRGDGRIDPLLLHSAVSCSADSTVRSQYIVWITLWRFRRCRLFIAPRQVEMRVELKQSAIEDRSTLAKKSRRRAEKSRFMSTID